jgi:Family of unknown function (DUF6176)
MLRVSFARIRPGKEQRLRAWLAELMTRKTEVLETFAHEGTRQEQAYVLATSDGPMLVYVMDSHDAERARAAYQGSRLALDLQHRDVLAECLADRLRLAPLYDCAVDIRGATAR